MTVSDLSPDVQMSEPRVRSMSRSFSNVDRRRADDHQVSGLEGAALIWSRRVSSPRAKPMPCVDDVSLKTATPARLPMVRSPAAWRA